MEIWIAGGTGIAGGQFCVFRVGLCWGGGV